MSKRSYVWAAALLVATMALAACGGAGGTGGSAPGDSAATTDAGAADNVPSSDAEAEGAGTGSDTSGAGDTSGANSAGEAAAANDVGTGSDGVAGSGGSNEAGGTTSPESDTGAPTEGDDTGNAESGTGDLGNEASSSADSVTEGGTSVEPAAGTGDNNAQAAGNANTTAYTAISDDECTKIQGQLNEALGMEVSRTTGAASFSDLNGVGGESCQLTISGTGEQFSNLANASGRIAEALSNNGWMADARYAADSATGTIGALRLDNQLAAYNIEMMPGPATSCPADQPMSACIENLTPDQILYNITIDLAQQ